MHVVNFEIIILNYISNFVVYIFAWYIYICYVPVKQDVSITAICLFIHNIKVMMAQKGNSMNFTKILPFGCVALKIIVKPDIRHNKINNYNVIRKL